MKALNKIALAALTGLALVSCEDLDTKYEGGYVTTDQKQAVLNENPSLASASVAGISAIASSYMTVYSNHFDFGYPAIMIGLDLQGNDMICDNTGYNWYNYWEGYTSPTPSGTPAAMAWYHLYKQILNCNNVAENIQDPTVPDLQFYRAQALATRAFDYWVLAQLFQFNYSLVPDAPCVPIILDTNKDECAVNGAPRATVTEVYAQIMADLDEAIELLTLSKKTPEEMLTVQPKRMVSLATAYGLRARANLSMHRYAQAAQDAQSAISSYNGRPYTIDEVSHPTFTNIDDASWMWGIAIAETDRVVTSGIVNFPSMTCTFCANGYVAVGAWKFANQELYDNIPATDVRKGWFLGPDLTSPNLSKAEQAYIDSYNTIPPYAQVKYAGYQNVVGQSTNASDIPLMRIEEMYYILAEGKVRSGDVAGGKQVYEQFTRAYRNPTFTCKVTSQEEVAEAIYQDRRVEFFCEGLSYFDIMRLDKSVDHSTAGNYPAAYKFIIPSYSADTTEGKTASCILIYCIPTGEINGNPAISEKDNNPSGLRPTPIS